MTCLTSVPLVLQKCGCSTTAVFSQRLRLVPDSDSATHYQGARHRVSGVLPHCFLGVTDTCSFVKYSNHVLVRADSEPSAPHPTPPHLHPPPCTAHYNHGTNLLLFCYTMWWSLCTLYLFAGQVRVTVGDSGLCCCVGVICLWGSN